MIHTPYDRDVYGMVVRARRRGRRLGPALLVICGESNDASGREDSPTVGGA